MRSHRLTCLIVLLSAGALRADGLRDNSAENVRPIPPAGIVLEAADRADLQAGLDEGSRAIDELQGALKERPELLELLPDVQILFKAVRYALTYNELFDPKEIASAKALLKQGLERAKQLRAGQAPWTTATGLVVRGYVSKIDGSVQPYGLVVPATFQERTPHRFRLDVWCHGRGETLSEVNFITGRQSSPGEFTPTNAFVLHPYGRFCNAAKFAGEVDVFEALDHVKRHYPIDDDRLVMRGFSMGGAACWHFATHYPSTWAAAAPGAGFSETPDFLKTFQGETLHPTSFELKLWHLYDCTDYAINLFNCPTVAYSGSEDRQKQAADQMERALAAEGIDLVHIIGAGAGHEYTAAAKVEINRRIDSLAAAGREVVPEVVHFTTWTLRYNRSAWVELDGLEQHWNRARVNAELLRGATANVRITTENVSGLTLRFPAGRCPFDLLRKPQVEIDKQIVAAPQPLSDRSWVAHFGKVAGKWQAVASDESAPLQNVLHKRHGLQGPIDDAFWDSFLMVAPTGPAFNEQVGKWTAGEMQHAIEHWRRQFRGDALVKNDKDITEDDIAAHNLILWGDPSSNAILTKIADRLPIRWTKNGVQLGDKVYFPPVLVLICPNPLNPKRYVVLNSGFTYREYDYLNNARQVPKLPDFALIDISKPASSKFPGGITTAGFFDENWQLPPAGQE